MKKDEVLKYVETKGDESFIVRTEAEEKSFLENYGLKIEEEKVGMATKKIYNDIDNEVVFKLTGQKRKMIEGEKSSEFYSRVLLDYKSKAEKAGILEKEIADLKKQIADGTADKKTLADLESVQKAYKELEDTKTKEVTDLRTQFEKYKDQTEIISASSGLMFKKNIPETAIKSLVNQVISELTSVASRQDGKLVFLKDGVPMRNPHNALNPYTADELLKERLKDVLDINRKIDGGPGLNQEVAKEYDTTGKLTKIAMIIPDSIKTKEDLSKFLVSQKLLRGSQEYILAYKEYSTSLPHA